MEKEIATFFRDFAFRILTMEHADPNSPREVKQALVNHFEEIYPAFAMTEVFKQNFEKAGHNKMVEVYKANFSLLLLGKLPEV